MATDDDPPFKVEQRDRDGNRIERVIGRAENLIVGRVLSSYNVAARCIVRPSIAERRLVLFCETCGVQPRLRHPATNSAVS
jgi:hypothetical protein